MKNKSDKKKQNTKSIDGPSCYLKNSSHRNLDLKYKDQNIWNYYDFIFREIEIDKIFNKDTNFCQMERNALTAEFICIMLGDGSLYNDGYHVTINLNRIDEPRYVNYVKSKILDKVFWKNVFKLRNCKGWPIKKKGVYFESTKKSIHNYICQLGKGLIKTGLVPGDKVNNQVDVPEWVYYTKHQIRRGLKGLFDTDGDISIVGSGNFRIGFTNASKPLVCDFLKMCELLGIKSNKVKLVEDKRESGSWKFQLYNTNDIRKFLKIVNPEKFKEPARRVWLACWIILNYCPLFVKNYVEDNLKTWKKKNYSSYFMYSLKNSKLLKNWIEQGYNRFFSENKNFKSFLSDTIEYNIYINEGFEKDPFDFKNLVWNNKTRNSFMITKNLINFSIKTALSGNPQLNIIQLTSFSNRLKILRFPSYLRKEITKRIFKILQCDTKIEDKMIVKDIINNIIKFYSIRIFNELKFITRKIALKEYFEFIIAIIHKVIQNLNSKPEMISATYIIKSISNEINQIQFTRKLVRTVLKDLEIFFPEEFKRVKNLRKEKRINKGSIPKRYKVFGKLPKRFDLITNDNELNKGKIIFKKDSGEVFNFPIKLKCIITRFIYALINNTELSNIDDIVCRIKELAVNQNFKLINEVYKNKINSLALDRYFIALILIIREIIARKNNRKNIARQKVKDHFNNLNIKIPFSAKTISEIIWCLKSGYHNDFESYN